MFWTSRKQKLDIFQGYPKSITQNLQNSHSQVIYFTMQFMDKFFKAAALKTTWKGVLLYWNGKKNLLLEEIITHIVADIWIVKSRSYNNQIKFYNNSWSASYVPDPAPVKMKSKLPLPCPIPTMVQKVWI